MAGLPGIAVPAGLDRSGPADGLQLIGGLSTKRHLFRAGQVIENAPGRFSRTVVVRTR
jgi:aspartyl-tRNA(Asn)/glutamyl-tRNA(Gln) amidotransferase subunit A